MKYSTLSSWIAAAACVLILNSCHKNSNVWDDSNNIGSYKRAKERILWGEGTEGTLAFQPPKTLSLLEDDFVPLQDDDLKQTSSELVFAQSSVSPGEENSPLPGIQSFQIPKGALAAVFRSIYFNTDDFSIQTEEIQSVLKKIATYLSSHPKTHIFVEGHCDQRGAEAYNLSLGSKRANAIRNGLIQHGADAEQIHTISYGKEKPAAVENTPEAWAQNRRAQFKIYEKNL
ncbi:MAG: hypothetical protein FJZ58_02080 [Chlamydiae bacterium]|nr:hypothetical protein [Chlamydiota bacterium]